MAQKNHHQDGVVLPHALWEKAEVLRLLSTCPDDAETRIVRLWRYLGAQGSDMIQESDFALIDKHCRIASLCRSLRACGLLVPDAHAATPTLRAPYFFPANNHLRPDYQASQTLGGKKSGLARRRRRLAQADFFQGDTAFQLDPTLGTETKERAKNLLITAFAVLDIDEPRNLTHSSEHFELRAVATTIASSHSPEAIETAISVWFMHDRSGAITPFQFLLWLQAHLDTAAGDNDDDTHETTNHLN